MVAIKMSIRFFQRLRKKTTLKRELKADGTMQTLADKYGLTLAE